MGKYKDTHGYSRFSHWLGLDGRSLGDVLEEGLQRLKSSGTELGNQFGSFLNSFTGAHMTNAQVESNTMQMQNVHDQYQRQVSGMQDAGLNPALMYGNGAGSSAPAAPSSPGTGSMSDLMQLVMLPLNKKLLQAQTRNVESDTKKNAADAARSEADTEKSKAETEQIKVLTPHQVDEIVSRIDLNASNLSLNQAKEAVETANAALLSSDAAVRDRYNEINLRLAEANAAKSESEKDKILKETDLLIRDYVLTFAQEAALKAQAGYYSQETLNALTQNDILFYDAKKVKYEAKLTEYDYDHADGNRIWNRIQIGAGALRDAGVGIGAGVSAFTKLPVSPTPTVTESSSTVYNAAGNPVRTVVSSSHRNK